MERPAVLLIQKEESPLWESLARILDQECQATVWRGPMGSGTDPTSRNGVVVWDVHGYTSQERLALSSALAPEEMGVVVVSPLEPGLSGLLRACGAWSLVVAPLIPGQVAAAVEMALAAQERLNRLLVERADLQRQLGEREVIERAKRVLMAAGGYSEAEAMGQLQKQARNTNQKLIEVAGKVLTVYQMFNGD